MRQELVDQAIRSLWEAFKTNPFDYHKENDVTCFLYGELLKLHPQRVAVELDSGIDRFGAFPARLMTVRVHTEGKGGKDSNQQTDIYLLEDRPNRIQSKTKNMIGRFEYPFLVGIEIKLSYGKTNRTGRTHLQKDFEKLAGKRPHIIKHPYVLLVDFNEGQKSVSHMDYLDHLSRQHFVSSAYVGLDQINFFGVAP